MTSFHYKAVDDAGKFVSGFLDESSSNAALITLRQKGLLPVRIEEKPSRTKRLAQWLKIQPNSGLTNRQLSEFTLSLFILVQARLPLGQAMQLLLDQSKPGRLHQFIAHISNQISGGVSLHNALASAGTPLPLSYLAAIKAGEMAGKLDETLERLSTYLRVQEDMREKVRSALIYPVILLVMAIFAIVIVINVVVPELEPFFTMKGDDIPKSADILLSVSHFLTDYGWVIPLFFIFMTMTARQYIQTKSGRLVIDGMLLKIPLVSTFIVAISVAAFCRTMGMQLKSKVPILEALGVAQQQCLNATFSGALKNVSADIERGSRLSDALKIHPYIPIRVTALMEVGEKSGALEDMMERIAAIYEQDIATTTARFFVVLTPVITLLLGGLVAAILLTVFAAILDINTLIG